MRLGFARPCEKSSKPKRRGRLALLTYFRRLLKLDLPGTRPTSRAPSPLPADIRATSCARISSICMDPDISASFVLNPALIGGMRIQVASDVYDGSVRADWPHCRRAFDMDAETKQTPVDLVVNRNGGETYG